MEVSFFRSVPFHSIPFRSFNHSTPCASIPYQGRALPGQSMNAHVFENGFPPKDILDGARQIRRPFEILSIHSVHSRLHSNGIPTSFINGMTAYSVPLDLLDLLLVAKPLSIWIKFHIYTINSTLPI